MKCLVCDNTTRVINTQRLANGIHRWRRCNACNKLVRTVERPVTNEDIAPPRRSETSSNAILTDADVLDIRRRFDAGATRRQISEQTGMSYGTISHIVARRTWKHV